MGKNPVTRKDAKTYLERALKAADWFVNAQIKCPRPWQADHGRFLYYYYMPEKKEVPGLNWTHGRAMFVLTDAFRATGDRRYVESMELGARYVRALQPLDPYYPITYGAIREEIPQAPHGGMLDGAQAASGLLMLHTCTGHWDYLRRGRAFGEFLLRTWRPDVGLASSVRFYPTEQVRYASRNAHAIHHVTAIPLWHLFCLTGEGQFLPPLIDAANRLLECQRPDGAFNYVPDVSGIDQVPFNHHWGLGEGDQRFILRNDDGMVVVIQAAWLVTKDRKYLDSLVAYADWTIENEPHERPYNAFGIQATNVLDVGKMAEKDYSAWVLDHLEQHCLSKQALGTGDPKAEGGFRGEDEEGHAGIFGGAALDYVPTRNTCYMAGLLFRLSGKGAGAGFSVWGVQRNEGAGNYFL
jgi:hypothetical protein